MAILQVADQQHQNHSAALADMPQDAASSTQDIRLQATKSIWGGIIPLMGISIPLTAIVGGFSGSAALLVPLSIVAGAAVSTAVVWNPFARRPASHVNVTNIQEMLQLEERIASLEMILSYEEKLLDSKVRREAQLQNERDSNRATSMLGDTAIHTEPVMLDQQTTSVTTSAISSREAN